MDARSRLTRAGSGGRLGFSLRVRSAPKRAARLRGRRRPAWLLQARTECELRQRAAKISHVVIIVQENRSVDNLFSGLKGADTVKYGYDSAGKRVTLQPIDLTAPYDLDHEHRAYATETTAGTWTASISSASTARASVSLSAGRSARPTVTCRARRSSRTSTWPNSTRSPITCSRRIQGRASRRTSTHQRHLHGQCGLVAARIGESVCATAALHRRLQLAEGFAGTAHRPERTGAPRDLSVLRPPDADGFGDQQGTDVALLSVEARPRAVERARCDRAPRRGLAVLEPTCSRRRRRCLPTSARATWPTSCG